MKTNLRYYVPVLLISFLFACSSGGDSPKAVADNFLKSLNKMDYEGAKKYGTEDTGKLLDMIGGLAKMMPDSAKKEKKYEIVDEKIEGDKATVNYKDEDGSQTLNLVKQDGKWKVAMSKDSMNGSDESNMESGATSTDTTGMMPEEHAADTAH